MKQRNSRPAAIEGDAVLVSRIFRNFDLALANSRRGSIGDVVTVHTSSLHELDGLVDTGLGDWVGRLDIACDGGSDGIG